MINLRRITIGVVGVSPAAPFILNKHGKENEYSREEAVSKEEG